jgi:protein involved in polysaccharide export with SLBB domain
MVKFASAFRLLLTIVIVSQVFVTAQTKTEPQKGNSVSRLKQSLKATGKKHTVPARPNESSKVDSAPVSNVSPPSPEPARSSGVASFEPTQTYRVGVGDVLDVRMRDTGNQSTLFTVTANGLLEYPVLNQPLQVGGLTIEEIGERLKSELKRLALNEAAEVLIGIREYNSHTILISGLVKQPGSKILRREAIPLYVVLAEAQPLPEAGYATVIAHETGKPATVDLFDPQATGLLLGPGDVINVRASPKQFFYIAGDVTAPGEKAFRSGLKLTQAILVAGGLTRKAKAIELAREGENGLLGRIRYKLEDINSGTKPDPLVQAGDRITVVH